MASKIDSEYPYGECPKCGGSVIKDHHEGAIVCRECGYAIDREQLDMGPEWRAFNQKQFRARVRSGPPMTYTVHDKGLSTVIDWIPNIIDQYGERVSKFYLAILFASCPVLPYSRDSTEDELEAIAECNNTNVMID